MSDREAPKGDVTLRTLAMPADANPSGDIFGGWVLSQMDMASSMTAIHQARGRIATVAVDSMQFISPVRVGDVLEIYTSPPKVGRTSMQIFVEAWAIRQLTNEQEKVTEAMFTFVALNESGRPREVPVQQS